MNPVAVTSSLAAPCVPRIHILLDRHARGMSGPKLMRRVRKLRRKLSTAEISAPTGNLTPSADRRLWDAS